MKRFSLFLMTVFLLAGCNPQTVSTPSTPPAVASPSPSAELVDTPIATPTSLPPLPALQVISAQNATQVHLLRTLDIPGYRQGATSQCNPAFDPSGDLLAAVCGVSPISVWEVAIGWLLYSLDTGGEQMVSCTFSPDSTLLACAGFGGSVLLWDAVSGEQLTEIAAIGSPIWEVVFSPDGTRLATCGV
jgi:WD40 repeat protein